MDRFRSYCLFGLGSLLLSLTSPLQHSATAAQSLPECQPPRSDEYLLLVPNPQAGTQSQMQQLLPANAVLTPCNYFSTSVVRVEGFASADIATAWAKYLIEMAGVQAYVARPANSASSVATPPASNGVGGTSSPVPGPTSNSSASSPATEPIAPRLAYNPQPLGVGYAVLVNYFNRPELAASVRQITTRDVGLVAFEQQPYLLASHTTDATVAATLLRTLTEKGLTVTIVDSRRAVLLTPAVK